ncbi:MAG: FadR/GntR family transcriptional regulator [Chloroflexota bacterium]|nr:FadR/GntR family transcriptional regulator [Chloroflexota bacterium]
MVSAEKVRRITLSQQVAAHVYDHVRRNQLKAGDRLPSQESLARQLGVSRAVVREAFSALSAAGIVEVKNGSRPRVSTISRDVFSQLVWHGLATDQILPSDVLEVRQCLEVTMAKLAARRRSAEDVSKMRAIIDEMTSVEPAGPEMAVLDRQLHQAIARATRNSLLEALVPGFRKGVWDSVDPSLRPAVSNRQARDAAFALESHKWLVDAIARGDETAAGRLMEEHLRVVADELAGPNEAQGSPKPNFPLA